MKKTTMKRTLSIAITFLITGCSGEPSGADIENAFNLQLDQANKQMSTLMGGTKVSDMFGKTELHSVKKLGCVEAKEKSGFNCDVEVDMTLPFVGRQKRTQSLRLIEGDDGWVAIK